MAALESEDKRTRRTIAAIKEAFWEIAEEKGVDKVTVSEMAKRADINRKTFYHHFDSLESLEDLVFQEQFEKVADAIKDATVVEDGEINVNQLFQAISLQIGLIATCGTASFANIDLTRHLRHIEPIVLRVMSEKIPELFDDLPEQYLHYVATFFCSGLASSYRRWLEEDSETDMEELAAVLGASVTGGVSGVKEYVRVRNQGKASLPLISE